MTEIRDARIKLGRSQKEVARQAGIDARTLRKIENGEHVSEVSLNAVQRALDLPAPAPDASHSTSRSWPVALRLLSNLFPLLAILGIGLGLSALSVHIAVAALALLVSLGLLCAFAFLRPSPPNTAITITANTTSVSPIHFHDPAMAVRGWLGKEDARLDEVTTTATETTYRVRAHIDTKDYSEVVARLREIGLTATVSTAF